MIWSRRQSDTGCRLNTVSYRRYQNTPNIIQYFILTLITLTTGEPHMDLVNLFSSTEKRIRVLIYA